MKPKTRDFDLDVEQARALADVLRAYAFAAFPEGGSECAQVSRSVLLDTADRCRSHSGGPISLRRRQLPLLRAAVRWASGKDGPDEIDLPPDLASILD